MRLLEQDVRIPMYVTKNMPGGAVQKEPVSQFGESQMLEPAQYFLKLFKGSIGSCLSFQRALSKKNSSISPQEYFQLEKNGKGKAPKITFDRDGKKYTISYSVRKDSEQISIVRTYENELYDVISVFAGKPEYDGANARNEGQLTWSNPITMKNSAGDDVLSKIDYHYNDLGAYSAVDSVLAEIQGQASYY
jgi:hypothetical protein